MISVLWCPEQLYPESKTSLSYIARPFLKQKQKNKNLLSKIKQHPKNMQGRQPHCTLLTWHAQVPRLEPQHCKRQRRRRCTEATKCFHPTAGARMTQVWHYFNFRGVIFRGGQTGGSCIWETIPQRTLLLFISQNRNPRG